MSNELDRVAPPPLPPSPNTYSKTHGDKTVGVLQLFFRRFANTFNELMGRQEGGRFLFFPRGEYYSTNNQTVDTAGTAQPVTFNTVEVSSTVGLENDSELHVSYDGLYRVFGSLHMSKDQASDAAVTLFVAINGSSVDYSGARHNVRGDETLLVQWNILVDAKAGDYIEVFWAVDDTDLTLVAEPPASPHPGIASARVSITYASNTL